MLLGGCSVLNKPLIRHWGHNGRYRLLNDEYEVILSGYSLWSRYPSVATLYHVEKWGHHILAWVNAGNVRTAGDFVSICDSKVSAHGCSVDCPAFFLVRHGDEAVLINKALNRILKSRPSFITTADSEYCFDTNEFDAPTQGGIRVHYEQRLPTVSMDVFGTEFSYDELAQAYDETRARGVEDEMAGVKYLF